MNYKLSLRNSHQRQLSQLEGVIVAFKLVSADNLEDLEAVVLIRLRDAVELERVVGSVGGSQPSAVGHMNQFGPRLAVAVAAIDFPVLWVASIVYLGLLWGKRSCGSSRLSWVDGTSNSWHNHRTVQKADS